MPRQTSEPTLDQYGDETHPAFGMISVTRVSGQATLFDSDVQHQHYVVVKMAVATRKRYLNRDWLHRTGEFLEIAMSEAQWASFVSSFNLGSGVPCTITYRDGKQVDALPYAPRMAESLAEVNRATDKTFKEIREATERLEAVIADPKAGVRARKEAMRDLSVAVSHTKPNLRFAAQSLSEYAEGVVQRSRADIEAMVVVAAEKLGVPAAQIVLGLPMGDEDEPKAIEP